MRSPRNRWLYLLSTLLIMLASPAWASDYPARPITLIVPYGAGGTTDISARQLARLAEPLLGQPVVIENRPGGGGVNAMRTVSRAAPDGYTLIATTSSPSFVAPALRDTGYDTLKDFTPILNYSGPWHGVLVNADSPYHTLTELLDAARDGSRLTYATAGALSGARLAFTQLGRDTDARLQHVPFDGAAGATAALLGHHVDIALVPAYRDLVKSDQLRLLAVLDDQPDPDFPEVPTLEQSGYDIQFPSIVALMVPHGVSAKRAETLRAAFSQAASSPEFAAVMKKLNQPVRLLPCDEVEAVIGKNLVAYHHLAETLKR
ncbi:tripartite tricarboxylate transporter substrate binding protein [Larsenimonas rhizosphaerae]|uniref:Tripartite tricarboxylate transporter substrate binding protein n=1 Tax=Larsenimonas rhizosphaerae TaxID=2944682 RepID=A0AA41ZJW1_9GAMM|nr:tripartite tricarboxylate transporter substrate binding protein [Larsenimonas rhizosphaerae]MCX2522928.1 tripartite tricarboxylate transporter substrate binding protein [Larsenimonas rhizosphaerae]